MAPPYPQFAGSLAPKLKSDILEIADKLNLKGLEGLSKNELMTTVQQYLDENEAKLSKTDLFKGLYTKRKRTINGRPSEEMELDIPGAARRAAGYTVDAAKPAVSSAVETGRHYANRGVQKFKEAGINPADVPLPDSVRTSRTMANNALEKVAPVANVVSKRITQTAKDTMVMWQETGKKEVLQIVRKSQKTLSNSETIILVMLFCEMLLLLFTIIPQAEYELQFPPSQFSSNPLARAVYAAFSWAPEVKAKFRIPSSMFSYTPGTEILKDIFVWVFTTVLPPYALAHVITFSKPRTLTQHGGRHNRHTSFVTFPTMDPLVFALVRLAILLLPLTSAAPDLWRFSLEKMGSVGGRALAAGLTAGFVLADRLGEV